MIPIKYYIIYALIKFSIIILCSFNIFNINYYKIEINLDNELPPEYEKNINYTKYSSILKPIALYYPEFNNINLNYLNINSINISIYKGNINRNQNNINYEKQNKLEKIKAVYIGSDPSFDIHEEFFNWYYSVNWKYGLDWTSITYSDFEITCRMDYKHTYYDLK